MLILALKSRTAAINLEANLQKDKYTHLGKETVQDKHL